MPHIHGAPNWPLAGASPPVPQDPGVIHVHGLGINPRDGALYAATHTGLFVIRDGAATRAANHYQDNMGFTVLGPDHFIGSGHPDLRDQRLLGRPTTAAWVG
jgi:hypothetical protein